MLVVSILLAIENSRLYEKTLIRSRSDSLTGLWNHGFFQESLEFALSETKQKTSYLSVLFLDLDNFKLYNDTWGHRHGDEVLIAIAKLIRETSRKKDFVSRYGGEEFAIILPQTEMHDAMMIAERIRSTIERYDFDPPGEGHPPQRITISIGIATFPTHAHSKTEILLKADEALYQAKNSGKNKVVCASV